MLGFFIAVISGILMAVQGVFNTGVTKASSVFSSATFVQFSSLVVCFILWALFDRTGLLQIFKVEQKYMLLGGPIGAFITYTVIVSINRLGPAKSAMFIVIAQLIMAYLIEVMGLFGVDKTPLSVKKLLGLAVAIIGIVIFKWEST